MIGLFGRLGAAATLRQHCPQMTQRPGNQQKGISTNQSLFSSLNVLLYTHGIQYQCCIFKNRIIDMILELSKCFLSVKPGYASSAAQTLLILNINAIQT